MLFLYNTGARADEAARVTIGDLTLAKASSKEHSLVQVHGKGDRLRRCPLWPKTVAELAPLVDNGIVSTGTGIFWPQPLQ